MEEILNNISNIKLNKKDENVETYEGNMKILFKKIKIKNENDIFYYKSILNNKKIYDIIQEENNIYIYYDSNENIDELLNNNFIEKKEAIIDYEPIKKNEIMNLFEKEDSMCKIKFRRIKDNNLENMIGSGFFLE